MRRDALIFAGALAIRVAHVLAIRRGPLFRYLLIDSQFYDEFARRLATGGGFPDGPFFMNVLYGVFLAAVYAVFGADGGGRLAALFVQALLGAASCVLVARLGDRLVRPREGLAAAIALALYGPAIFYDGALLTPSLLLFLTTLALWLAVVAERDARLAVVASLGIVTGLLILGRANNALFLPVFAALLSRKHRSMRPVAWMTAAAALVVAPATIRNAIVTGGEVVPVTANAGMAMWAGNHEGATGIYSAPAFLTNPVPDREAEDYRLEASRRAGRDLTLAQSSRFWVGETLARWAGDPAGALRLVLRKARLFVNATESQTNLSYYFAMDHSWVLAIFRVHLGWILPFAAIGAVVDFRRVNLLVAGVVVSLATCVVFYLSSEYRHPVVPALLILAACGARWCWEAFRSSAPAWRKAVLAAAIVLGFVGANFRDPFLARLQSRRVDYLNFGTLALMAGKAAEAEAFVRRSIEIDPAWPVSRAKLAEILLAQGRGREAGEEAEASADLGGGPLAASPALEAARRLFDAGDFVAAGSAFLAVAEQLGPEGATAFNNAGLCAMRTGDTELADKLFRRALEVDSSYVSPRVHLGRLALAAGDSVAARRFAEEALAREPSDGRAQRLRERAGG